MAFLPRKVVVVGANPYDSSEEAFRYVTEKLTTTLDTLIFVHVVEHVNNLELHTPHQLLASGMSYNEAYSREVAARRAVGQTCLDNLGHRAHSIGYERIETVMLEGGDVAEQLITFAVERNATVIVVGLKQDFSMEGMAVQGVGFSVVFNSPIPVIMVPSFQTY